MRLFSRRVHELAGAYALDALDDAERERFERHLARCSSCTEDIRQMTSTATAMVSSAAHASGVIDAVRVRSASAGLMLSPPVHNA